MILNGFLSNIIDFINIYKEDLQKYKQDLKTSGQYKDFDKRFTFDLFYMQSNYEKRRQKDLNFDFLQYIADICKIADKNKIDENHIFTVYKKAIKEANL